MSGEIKVVGSVTGSTKKQVVKDEVLTGLKFKVYSEESGYDGKTQKWEFPFGIHSSIGTGEYGPTTFDMIRGEGTAVFGLRIKKNGAEPVDVVFSFEELFNSLNDGFPELFDDVLRKPNILRDAKVSGQQQKWLKKDQEKVNKANKMIATPGSIGATGEYMRLWLEVGLPLNCGEYDPNDIVFVSANGKRTGAKPPHFDELMIAVQGRAMFIADAPNRRPERGNPYNVGEQKVADFLRDQGYKEEVHQYYSIWKPQ